MTKTDIIKELAKRSNTEDGIKDIDHLKLTQEQASAIFNEILDIIVTGLKEDSTVQITGFGTFRSNYVAARKSKNLRTGEPCMISSRNQVSFSSGAKLKAAVNE